MIIKSSNVYHIVFIGVLVYLVLLTCFLIWEYDIGAAIMFIPAIGVVRAWIAMGRTLIMNAEGCTVQFLWYRRTYRWTELKTKRIEDYTNRFGYRDPYTAGAIFCKKQIKKQSRWKPGSYSARFYVHPFSFFFVYFDPHIPAQERKYQMSDIYVVEEAEFRKNMAEWNVELEETNC